MVAEIWGYALHVFPQEKKEKCTPARWGKNIVRVLPSPVADFWGPIWEGGGRARTGKSERQTNIRRARANFFSAAIDHVYKMVFHLP